MNLFSKTSAAEEPKQDGNVRNVIVVGAGPAGLLLTSLLLRRNTEQSSVKYKVTLIESRVDLGMLDPATELKAYKSWMISLAGHGIEAIRTIPELWKNYMPGVGVDITKVCIFLGAKEIKLDINKPEDQGAGENYIVDRNYVVAALARYLNETHGESPFLERRYETQIMYVDYENHRVLTRKGEKEEYINYDLLVGSDGVRSVVREALVKRHHDFKLDVSDIFQNFKAVHVTRPKKMDADALSLLPTIFPHMQGIALPETDGQMNISIGVPRNKFDILAPELKSDDPKVVAEFLKKNLKAFELDDYDDFAEQWVASRWNQTGMVHCNFYHSLPCKIVIMGDAAHATSPSIGMGMNTALRDAQKFNELLEKFDDDLELVLPQFSKDRVKEGNSLTDLAYYLYCFDTRHQLFETLHMLVRGFLSTMIPSLVSKHPQMLIGSPGSNLSEVYQLASDQGIIQKHRKINDKIRQEHFEMEIGMLTKKPRSLISSFVAFWIAILAAAAYYFLGGNK